MLIFCAGILAEEDLLGDPGLEEALHRVPEAIGVGGEGPIAITVRGVVPAHGAARSRKRLNPRPVPKPLYIDMHAWLCPHCQR